MMQTKFSWENIITPSLKYIPQLGVLPSLNEIFLTHQLGSFWRQLKTSMKTVDFFPIFQNMDIS